MSKSRVVWSVKLMESLRAASAQTQSFVDSMIGKRLRESPPGQVWHHTSACFPWLAVGSGLLLSMLPVTQDWGTHPEVIELAYVTDFSSWHLATACTNK